MRPLILGLAAIPAQVSGRARDPAGFEDGHDLQQYVSRPDLAAPRYQVTKHQPDTIAPGYWIVAPYAGLVNHAPFNGRREHTAYQVGAHIYDGDGGLIWSGARRYDNRNAFGIKPITYNDALHLALHVSGEDLGDDLRSDPAVIILNDEYEEVIRFNDAWFDLHEFNVLEGGRTALVTTKGMEDHNATEINEGVRSVVNPGFREIELSSGRVTYDWTALAGGVKVNESYDAVGMATNHGTWDFAHINAVDKFANGDYLVSARHTSTVYRIAGTTGQIIWRLGGYASDFTAEDDNLEFIWQHHVRIWSDNATRTLISIFDNHGDDQQRNPDMPERTSAVKFIMLNTVGMTAELVRRVERPDGAVSRKLGNVQVLSGQDDIETATLLIDWGYEGYLSEHTASDVVMEARFVSDRMSSYRGYKSTWVGRPKETPALTILPMATADGVVAAFYTSWNGATEVASWSFYGCDSEDRLCRFLGNATRSGFETSFVARDLVRYGYADAVDVHGALLRRSAMTTVAETALTSYNIDASNMVNPDSQDAMQGAILTQSEGVVSELHHVIPAGLFGTAAPLRVHSSSVNRP
ncbi:hypothetical protein DOTSEDRAFT_63571 [Dothistroma septosporum NZE10]|uniref:ASST-domain-containing protein n=1 Tax=Dothistroma septosporum (strain NZE10 / CBS 128990) TaxID=675120 RepID=M2YMY2_DOTSN|nr:hypothetical protein DOTSEDRAFT_63571 [Dothistroma septosporum NZE10]